MAFSWFHVNDAGDFGLIVVKNLLTCGPERRMMCGFISLSAAPPKKKNKKKEANVLSESLFVWDFFFGLNRVFPLTNGSD